MEKTEKCLSKRERIFRTVIWAALETLVAVSLCVTAVRGDVMKVLMCVFTSLLLLLPFAMTKLLHFEMHVAFFVFCELYAIGPMCGHVYNLYYYTSWWDDLLHTVGGFVFAIFGVYLAEFIGGKNPPSVWLKAVFALCFSMALAVAWEFVEYGCDCVFGTDMQNDTVIHSIHSYLLSGETAQTGTLDGITEVWINGQPLGVGGYLDIGLHDTMHDMLVETFGAVVYTVIYAIDRERHPLLYRQVARKEE